jgi:uncharacterized surface protein with fasciclin (FAS1) repeats
MMDGLKIIVSMLSLLVLLAAVATPAMAQSSSDTLGGQASQDTQIGQAQQGQAQQGQTQQGQTQQAQQGQVQQGEAQQGQTATEDLMTLIENNPDLSAYAQALKASGNDQKLTGEGAYMIFAPTDDSIKRDLGYSNATTLSSAGKYMLEGTIVQNPQAPSEGSTQAVLTAINGERIDVVKSDSQAMANSVKMTKIIPATNGILVVTDGVV